MSNPLSVVVAAGPGILPGAVQAPAILEALRRGGFDLRLAQANTAIDLGQALSELRWDVLLLADDLPGQQ